MVDTLTLLSFYANGVVPKTGSQFAMAARGLQRTVRKQIVIIAINRFSGPRPF
ncbi:hypothetical protein [Paraburkholderia sacchari]|uniref:hypothetical protein n=1 Tax=Paraburkholderia sacchari TaxID=159450 RepID=UPI0039A60ABD